ncbi:hypothetical protein BH23VER1_BH23VER1_19010 [soil metagenome]
MTDFPSPILDRFWDFSGQKIRRIANEYDHSQGSPVFTIAGRYTTRGWTEWTQGFEFGSAALQFEATGDAYFLELARTHTVSAMSPHLSHFGVHDHGFNNVSTYGTLLRLMREGTIPEREWERNFYELALKVSGAVQARRWTPLPQDGPGAGFIYSFNGPHSLFVDTIRSCRAVLISHLLGHQSMDEGDREISLLGRALAHAAATAKYAVFYGEGRDIYDTSLGRTAHESIFNTNDGAYRCPNSQQGYTGHTTWTRGLAWAVLGFAETLELLDAIPGGDGHGEIRAACHRAARATADFYLDHTPTDRIPYWDTGAPALHLLGDDLYQRPSDPFNAHEPVDSSAAAIAAQGLLRLGYLLDHPPYTDAALTAARALFSDSYLSTDPAHHGLILHSIYHRPNGWDHVPEGSAIPNGESSMWGDYHARELALTIARLQAPDASAKPYRYFDCVQHLRPNHATFGSP